MFSLRPYNNVYITLDNRLPTHPINVCDSCDSTLKSTTIPALTRLAALLLESVFTEYARYLYTIGLLNAAKYYCTKGGQEGKGLLQDIS